MYRTLIALAVFLAAVPMLAQPKPPANDEMAKEIQQFRTEMQQWFKAEVLPSLTAWHNEYDASLSSADLAKLKSLRQQTKDLREQIKNAERGDRKQFKDDMKAILDEVKPIAKNSRDKLRELFDENEDQIDAWRDEAHDRIEAFKEKMRDLRASSTDTAGRRGKGKHMKGQRGMGGHDAMSMLLGGGRKGALAFILWDGSTPEAPSQFMMPAGLNEPMGSNQPLSVTPNPSANTARVQMNGLPDGKTTIEVMDMNGRTMIRKDASVANGSINELISTDDLAPGSYMVSVNTSLGRRSTTIVIQK